MRSEKDKYNHYMKRTMEHIHRVHNNMLKIVTDFREDLELSDEDCRKLMYQVLNHDRSKFNEVQFGPYIELTEYYYQRKNLKNSEYEYPTADIKGAVEEAIQDHYAQENHHPEGRCNGFSHLECLEIICDLQAMAQEFNEGTCENYFENVWRLDHIKTFQPDDWEYVTSMAYMRRAIACFKREL